MSRFRKAVMAAVGAAVSAIITALVNGDKPASNEGWAALIGGAVGLGIMTAIGVYFARNTAPGLVDGSEQRRVIR